MDDWGPGPLALIAALLVFALTAGLVQAQPELGRSYPGRRTSTGDAAVAAELPTKAQGVDSLPAATAPTGTQYLHAADATVGAYTYNTLNSQAPVGAVTTATVSTGPTLDRTDQRFSDLNLVSIFASDPVPSGQQWTLGNPWSVDLRVSISTSNANIRAVFFAEIYRIDTSGRATLLYSESPLTGSGRTSSQIQGFTAGQYKQVTWSDSGIPATVIGSGERIGLAFLTNVDSNSVAGQSLVLGFDLNSGPTPTPSSGITTMTATESAALGVARVAHFRIGNDADPNAMTWRAETDIAAGPVLAGQTVRVRFQVYNNGGAAYVWTGGARLDYATSPNPTTWNAVPTLAGTNPIYVVDSSLFANGASIIAASLGQRAETWQNGVAFDANNPNAVANLGLNSYTEIEYNVRVTTYAPAGTQYYFRLSRNGTALTSYAAPASIVVPAVSTPGPTPSGPTPTPQPPAHNFNQPYGADTSACAACHRAHTAKGIESLRKAWPEEQVCYTCHDGTSAPNIRSEFAKTYRMPITQTTGVHRTGEARTGSAFTGANRHVECEDCHNPHEVGARSHVTGTAYAAGPQQGIWGVTPAWSAWWSMPSYTTTNRVTYQYELCLKCHSSWTFGGNPPPNPSGGFPETDQSLEFNPYNASYHPVAAVGKNPFQRQNGTSYAGSLLNGLTPSSNLVCSDCHGSESSNSPRGPHGSNNPFILRGTWSRNTGAGSTNALCFTCHSYNVYANRGNSSPSGTGFTDGSKNLHTLMVGARNKANGDAPIVCMDCHVAIPHGWKRPRLIGFTGDGAPYINRSYQGGLTTIDTWSASGTWTYDSCGTAMGNCK